MNKMKLEFVSFSLNLMLKTDVSLMDKRIFVNPNGLGSELLVDEAGAALVAEEAGLVPVLLLVGQILAVDADDLAALVAVVGEHILVALDAVRVVIAEDVAVSRQAVVAVVAEHGALLLV